MASNLSRSFICSRSLRLTLRVSRSQHRQMASLATYQIPSSRATFVARKNYIQRRAAYSTPIPSQSSSTPPPPPPAASAPKGITTALLNPRTAEDQSPLHVDITPRAAHRLSQIMAKDSSPTAMLRVTVESGGCHGFQYLMSLTDTSKLDKDDDTLFVHHSSNSADGDELGSGLPKVAMDRATLELLEGSKVDYTMELIGSQFKIVDNPRATSSCGCGTSFDVKALGDSGSGGW